MLADLGSWSLRVPMAGIIHSTDDSAIELIPSGSWEKSILHGPDKSALYSNYPAFLAGIGLLGMGGSRFPASIKLKASEGASTLVINGCECEPGVSIDSTVLIHDSNLVAAGARAGARAIGAHSIMLAVHKDSPGIRRLKKIYRNFSVIGVGSEYPIGAERLTLKSLSGRLPPAGVLPFQLGYLVQNASSLRAVGRAVIDGYPAAERPLSLIVEPNGEYHNLIVPIGLSIEHLLEGMNIKIDDRYVIISGGLMMGRAVDRHAIIDQGTTSLFIRERCPSPTPRSCIRCGACYDACPLGLHPIGIVDRLRAARDGKALRIQLKECFLCGNCSAVCPAEIPLAEELREGKKRLSK